MDKANRIKKDYLGIILFLKTNFDAVPPVSFGEKWSCVEKINLLRNNGYTTVKAKSESIKNPSPKDLMNFTYTSDLVVYLP